MADRKKRAGAKGSDAAPDTPRDLGADQAAGYHAGENLQPRNSRAGDVREPHPPPAADREGATTNPGPHQDTPFEARTERGEEWEDEGEAKRDVLDDLEGEGNPAARQAPPGR